MVTLFATGHGTNQKLPSLVAGSVLLDSERFAGKSVLTAAGWGQSRRDRRCGCCLLLPFRCFFVGISTVEVVIERIHGFVDCSLPDVMTGF